MPDSTNPRLARIRTISRLDMRRLSNRPTAIRLVLAGVVAVIASLLADIILVAVGQAAFNPPASFGPFHFGSYAPLTILGVVAATIGWAVLVHMSSVPRWVLFRSAVLVTVTLLVPDVLLLPTNPAGGVLTLMAMHVAIAIITYWSLLLLSPATGSTDTVTFRQDRVRV